VAKVAKLAEAFLASFLHDGRKSLRTVPRALAGVRFPKRNLVQGDTDGKRILLQGDHTSFIH
jgi:hypothetical protein